MDQATAVIDLQEVKKHATYSLPMWVWLWLQSEAAKRETNASALIVDLVRKEQEGRAA
jgi:hypothetical protein